MVLNEMLKIWNVIIWTLTDSWSSLHKEICIILSSLYCIKFIITHHTLVYDFINWVSVSIMYISTSSLIKKKMQIYAFNQLNEVNLVSFMWFALGKKTSI